MELCSELWTSSAFYEAIAPLFLTAAIYAQDLVTFAVLQIAPKLCRDYQPFSRSNCVVVMQTLSDSLHLVLFYWYSHFFIVSQQLKDGIRMLQMQAHNQDGTIQLCHTACVCFRSTLFCTLTWWPPTQSLYNGGTLQDFLGKGRFDNFRNPMALWLTEISQNFHGRKPDRR